MALDLLTVPYGAAAVDALAGEVARAKAGEPLRPVTVVVPSNYAGVATRRALARRGGVAGLTVVTLYRLAELLAGPALARSGRIPVSSPVVSTAVRTALAEEPGLFGPVADQPSTVEALRRAHRELRDLGPEERRMLGQDARSAAVLAIDARVTALLQGQWFDETDLMAAAAVAVGGDTADVGPLVVFLPQDVTSHGALLLRALAEHGQVTVLLGGTGTASGPGVRIAERLGAPLPPAASRPGSGGPPRPSFELVVAADEDDEVRAAVRRVLRAAEDGIPLERVAVVYAPGAVYGRLLVEHLEAARLPWNGVTDVPLAERVAGRTLLALLDADLPVLRRRDVFALLASAPPASGRPVASWERLAREAGVVAGRDQWEQRLAALAAADRDRAVPAPRGEEPGARADWREERAERAEELAQFVAMLADLLEPPASRTWSAYAAWSRTLLDHVLGPPSRRSGWPADEIRAAEEVERVLARIARLDAVATPPGPVGPAGPGPDLDDRSGPRPIVDRAVLRAAVDAELSDGLRTVGRLGEGLFVGPIPLAVGIETDLVIVLGLVEGGLPGVLTEDPLLAEASRRRTGGALRTAADRRALLHHQLLAVAGAASATVVASRPAAELRTGRAHPPSRWLADLRAGEPPARSVRHGSFLDGLASTATATGPPGSEQEASVAELAAVWRSGAPLETHPLAGNDVPLRHALTLTRARHSDRFTPFDGNLAELAAEGVDLAPRRPTAPTALEAWARCPYAYFVRYLLGVREPDRLHDLLTLRPADRGILVHAVLETVVTATVAGGGVPGPGEPWPESVQTALLAELDARCQAAEQRGIVGAPLHWRQEQRRLRRRLAGFLTMDLEARTALSVTPRVAELSFGRDTPVELALPGGEVLALTGQVDRVDVGEGRVAVIDYKTGRYRPEPGEAEDPLLGGRRLQLPVYGLAASRHLDLEDAEVVAEYWYLDHQRDGRSRQAVTLDEPLLERLGEVLATITYAIGTGLFVPHPDPPDPWRRARCPYCDPDGADTATLWSQWQHKQDDPALAPYLALMP